ncbi:MAG: hypothetical protein HQL76_17160 [Magnetococcales bacterium]|nr:hypothetical protein [Magnetococcales bacterium]
MVHPRKRLRLWTRAGFRVLGMGRGGGTVFLTVHGDRMRSEARLASHHWFRVPLVGRTDKAVQAGDLDE